MAESVVDSEVRLESLAASALSAEMLAESLQIAEETEEAVGNSTVLDQNLVLEARLKARDVNTASAQEQFRIASHGGVFAHQNIEDKAGRLLGSLSSESRVAIIVMVGSFCPVTLGHVACFVEARRLLLGLEGSCRPNGLEQFDACIGIFRMNSDGHVRTKMQGKGDPFLNYTERGHLIRLATGEHDWVGLSQEQRTHDFQKRWPGLRFTRFTLNGADDVAKYRKWGQASRTNRLITMGRPGDTEKVMSGVRKSGAKVDEKFFIMGPELPDISSSKLRHLLCSGETDVAKFGDLVHPSVAAWCIDKWKREAWTSRTRSRR